MFRKGRSWLCLSHLRRITPDWPPEPRFLGIQISTSSLRFIKERTVKRQINTSIWLTSKVVAERGLTLQGRQFPMKAWDREGAMHELYHADQLDDSSKAALIVDESEQANEIESREE